MNVIIGVNPLLLIFFAGKIYDSTGTWITPFYYISATIIAGGVIMWPYLIVSQCKRWNSTKQSTVVV